MNILLDIQKLVVARSAHFSLTVPALQLNTGSTLCLTGPNGSGKTTLLESIVGLTETTSGSIRIEGAHISQSALTTKTKLGYIPDDEDWFIKELCAAEYFDVLVRTYRQAGVTTDMPSSIASMAQKLGFSAYRQPLHTLSHGNKKKVQIIAGLLHHPPLIVVDELRNGLDPLAIIAAEDLLRTEKDRGAAILAATHDLWWAERFGEETMLLLAGKVAVHARTSDIIKRYKSLEGLFRTQTGLAT